MGSLYSECVELANVLICLHLLHSAFTVFGYVNNL